MSPTLAKVVAGGVLGLLAIAAAVVVTPGGSKEPPKVSVATSKLAFANLDIPDHFRSIQDGSGSCNRPVTVFVTDEDGQPISSWIDLRVDVEDVPGKLGKAFRKFTGGPDEPWKPYIDGDRLVPREGLTIRPDGLDFRVWVAKTPDRTPVNARVVMWK